MPRTKNSSSRQDWSVAAPLALAIVTMSTAILSFPFPAVVHDSYAYTMTALRLLRDGVFHYGFEPLGSAVVPDASITPGYPLILALFYAFTGLSWTDPASAVLATRPAILLVQAALGLLTVYAVSMIGRLVSGRWGGLVSGIAAALYLPFGWAATVSLGEQAGTAAFICFIWAMIAMADPKAPTETKTRTALLLGVLWGVVVMLRPALALWPLFPVLYVALARAKTPRVLAKITAFACVGFALVFAPWWVRNVGVTGTFTPIRSNTTIAAAVDPPGEPLPPATRGQIPAYSQDLVMLATQQANVYETHASEIRASFLTPWVPQLAVVWEDAFHPDLNRIGSDQSGAYSPGLMVLLVRYAYLYQWVIIGGAIIGLGFVRRYPRLLMLASVPLYVVAIHYTTQVSVRYMYPAMPAVVAIAGIGMFSAFTALRGRLRPAGAKT